VRGRIFDARQRDRDRLEKSKQRDENRRSRPSPGVSGDEESSVKEGEKKNVQGREGEGNLWSWCLKEKGKVS
jgi:hypothetical protein